jgi:hypothetical protein
MPVIWPACQMPTRSPTPTWPTPAVLPGHRVVIPLELGRPQDAVSSIPAGPLPLPAELAERRARFLIDVAAATPAAEPRGLPKTPSPTRNWRHQTKSATTG